MRLVPDDRARLHAAAEECPLTELRWVQYSFSFLFNHEGARAAAKELERRGFPELRVLEEETGDDYWHVVAWRRQSLTERVVANYQRQMAALAGYYGGTYDSWAICRVDFRP